MSLRYIHLQATTELPEPLFDAEPYKAVVVVQDDDESLRRSMISEWLVRSGCLYMMAWGKDADTWHLLVDEANLEMFDFSEVPDEKFVMTTSHTDSLQETFWYAKNCAYHSSVDLEHTLILHVARSPSEQAIRRIYAEA